ncbi:hypothetical protein A2U01_0098776, partial [Trifolium medium]|nr:hypothetical protein [Trifolium medium]
RVKDLEDRVRRLEDKLKETEGKSAEDVITEEEKTVDRAGIYAGLSRAMLVAKIFELNDACSRPRVPNFIMPSLRSV